MCRIAAAVFSPPYPNAYEYWLYHKYRMYWLGMDPISVREREIGARPNYFKKNPHTAADFECQMGRVFALLARVVVPGGHACFQVGDSIIRGTTTRVGLKVAAQLVPDESAGTARPRRPRTVLSCVSPFEDLTRLPLWGFPPPTGV